MKKRFTEEQIIAVLREAEQTGRTIGEVCRAHAISEQTFYRWRNKFGGMSVAEAKRLRELEHENAQLKRLLANRDLEVDGLNALLKKKC